MGGGLRHLCSSLCEGVFDECDGLPGALMALCSFCYGDPAGEARPKEERVAAGPDLWPHVNIN